MKWDNRSAFSRAPEGFHNRLVQTLSHLPEQKECLSMEKKRTWKRPAVLAAAAHCSVGNYRIRSRCAAWRFLEQPQL